MRLLSKVNCVFLALVILSCFYIFLLQSNEDLGSRSFEWFGEVDVKNRINPNFADKEKSAIENEVEEFKAQFRNLWRSSKNTLPNNDKVFELAAWTKKLANSEYLSKHAKQKNILVFDGIENYYGTNGKLKCPFLDDRELKLMERKCLIKESNLLDTIYIKYDAFVSVRNWRNVILDQAIGGNIKHIYYIQESPFVTKYADFSLNNAILASYFGGSDIVLPYGYFHKWNSSTINSSLLNTEITKMRSKTELVAIICSNCEPINNRLGYVAQLQKYIPVHIYGGCGPFKCHEDCFHKIKQEYKFYLAFEKANCREYITEKFWINALSNDAVPIVMGAHPEDYKMLAPPNSYIHVEDFKSPKDLANYLLLLDRNDDLYNKYFAYKNLGKVENIWEQFFCRLCSMLHYADIIQPPTWTESSSSWDKVNKCLPPNKWYWTMSEEDILS